ncbi:MAG: HD domain-containing protein [Pseudomonadota bacterium]
MPPTTTPPSAATGQQLEDLVTALRALEIPDPPLERAREIGGLVQDLSQDAALAAAALLNFARRAVDPTPTVPATLRARLGTETLSLADSLGRLGDFNLDEHWATGQTLGPGQAETVRKMLLAVVGDPRLVLARLAEQTVRARHARELPAKDRAQIALEIQELYAPLANRLGVWSLKWELEDLAFREQQPREYQRIAQALNEKRRDREQYIRIVLETLTTQLRMAGIEATVQGRPKHIYSIFRKMQRKQLPFEQVFDVRAARIIVPTVADCYAALGVVHDMWPFIPGEFDDYVATPKDNNYQSIHTAVHGPDGRPLEVQIRTQKMQDQAELGVAAHWRYKEGSNADRRYDQKILAIRQLIEGGGANSDELARISVGLFDDRIYAMTPKGEVVDLPKGGTPLDFAFHVHSNLGERCKGAKVNGRIAPLTHALKSGDVVEIITGKQPAPSRDWLSTTAGYLVSPRSRSKLRAYFRRLDEQSAQPAATTAEPRPAQAAAARSPRVRPAKTARSSRSPVAIDGVGDLPITLARCCGPVRPQPIRGYLTLGRGVTIHKADCPGLAHMLRQKPQRQLQVEWTDRDDVRLAARVQIEAFDRRGLLRDISDLIAEEHLSIEGVTSHTDPDNKIATFELRLAVKDVSELARLQRRLARIPNVYKVRRAR